MSRRCHFVIGGVCVVAVLTALIIVLYQSATIYQTLTSPQEIPIHRQLEACESNNTLEDELEVTETLDYEDLVDYPTYYPLLEINEECKHFNIEYLLNKSLTSVGLLANLMFNSSQTFDFEIQSDAALQYFKSATAVRSALVKLRKATHDAFNSTERNITLVRFCAKDALYQVRHIFQLLNNTGKIGNNLEYPISKIERAVNRSHVLMKPVAGYFNHLCSLTEELVNVTLDTAKVLTKRIKDIESRVKVTLCDADKESIDRLRTEMELNIEKNSLKNYLQYLMDSRNGLYQLQGSFCQIGQCWDDASDLFPDRLPVFKVIQELNMFLSRSFDETGWRADIKSLINTRIAQKMQAVHDKTDTYLKYSEKFLTGKTALLIPNEPGNVNDINKLNALIRKALQSPSAFME